MNQERGQETPFFVTGGTLAANAPSYLIRDADRQLLQALRQRKFCSVLNTRQVGKSSLMIRVAHALRHEGAAAIVIDITAGGFNLTPEAWYSGLALQLAEQLARFTQRPELEDTLEDAFVEKTNLGPAQRFFQLLEHDALAVAGESGLVVFLDEIDSVRLLPFSPDELFVGIRALYNRRAENPLLERLAFCLLGVATPAQLMENPLISPFNIGQRILLTDFTLSEAAPLAQRLPGGLRDLKRILDWTGGHPYLTQRLCASVAETSATVDSTVQKLFFTPGARETEDNLAFVATRLLRGEDDLSALLDLYGRVRSGNSVPNEATSPLCDALHLAGIVRTRPDGTLMVRNRIYAHVFDQRWIRQNLPDAEARRQRAAFQRGVVRTGALTGAVVTSLSSLTVWALLNAQRADHAATRADRAATRADREAQAARQAREMSERNRHRAEESQHRAEESQRRAEQLAQERAKALVSEKKARAAAVQANQIAQTNLGEVELALALRALESAETATAQRHFKAARTQGRLSAPQSALLHYCETALQQSAPRLRLQITCHDLVGDFVLSPDQRYLAVGTSEGWLQVFETSTGKEIGQRRQHGAPITTLCFLNSNRIATGGRDSHIRLWSLKGDSGLRPLIHTEHPAPLFQLVPSSDGNRLISCGLGGFVVWDTATGKELSRVWDDDLGGRWSAQKPSPIPTGYTALFTSPQADQLLFGAYGYVSNIADVATGKMVTATSSPLNAPQAAPDWIYQLRLAPSGNEVALVGHYARVGGGACVYDLTTGRAKSKLMEQGPIIHCADFSSDGMVLATGDEAGQLRFWDPKQGISLGEPALLFPSRFLTRLAWLADDDRLLAQTILGPVVVWSRQERRVIARFTSSRAFLLSPDKSLVITSGTDRTLSFWSLPPRQPHPILRVTASETGLHDELVAQDSYAWSTWLTPAFAPESSVVFDLKQKHLLRQTSIPPYTIHHSVSPDQRYLALYYESDVKIWDLKQQKRLSHPPPSSIPYLGLSWNLKKKEAVLMLKNGLQERVALP